MPRNRLLRAAFAALAVTALASARPVAAQTVMKLANATINDVQHEWQKLFAADLQKRIGDKVKTEIYPASQLGAIPRRQTSYGLPTRAKFSSFPNRSRPR
jgi:TRAP-type transport system periplasmic protein